MARNKLKEVLVKEGIKQAELASITEISHGSINKWANGSRMPSKTMQYRILKALHGILDENKYTIEDLF